MNSDTLEQFAQFRQAACETLVEKGWKLTDGVNPYCIAVKEFESLVGDKIAHAWFYPRCGHITGGLSAEYWAEGRDVLSTLAFNTTSNMKLDDIKAGVIAFADRAEDDISRTCMVRLFRKKPPRLPRP